MAIPFRIWLIILFLISVVISCTDHQLSPLSPQKVRLKTISSTNQTGVTTRTEYAYDATNRVTSFTTSTGSKGVFQYDEQNRYASFIFFQNVLLYPTTTEKTYFDYNAGDNNFQAHTDVVNNGFFQSTVGTRSFTVDANKRVLNYSGFQNGVYRAEGYSYTGDNITRVNHVTGRVTEPYSYEYDDKPNPSYKLIGPYNGLAAPDITEVQRFSRNNVLKIISDYNGAVFAEYTYEYNAQGLPLKKKTVNSSEQIVFTYESY